MILASALLCMALNVYHEARGESSMGQLAVAQVTMRRAEGDQANVCKVVYAKKQFSWTSSRKLRNQSTKTFDDNAWRRALAASRFVLEKRDRVDFSKGATHYHAKRVSPRWSRVLRRTTAIGHHIFYRVTKSRMTEEK